MRDLEIYTRFERLGELLRKGLRQDGAPHGLQPIHVAALRYLSVCNRFSNTPMAVTEYLGQTKGTMSQSLKVLEKKQFIVKVTDRDDRRIVHLRVTEAGQALLADMGMIPEAFADFLEGLDSAEKALFSKLIEKLLVSALSGEVEQRFGGCESCVYYTQALHCDLLGEPLKPDELALLCRGYEPLED